MRFDLNQYWAEHTAEHMAAAEKTFAALRGEFDAWLSAAAACIRGGGKILFFGNGGSAADAQHLATELAVRFIADRKPIAALALTTDTSALTAIGNDYGFDHLFARQIEALGRPGDLAVGLTTSGRSPNILMALEAAKALGLKTVGLTGRDGGDLPGLCDITLIVPSTSTARIQEMHITLGHMLCGALEQELGLT